MCVPCQAQGLLYACSARHSAFCLRVSWTMVPDVHLPFRADSVHSLESILPIVHVLCKSALAASTAVPNTVLIFASLRPLPLISGIQDCPLALC